MAHKPNLFLLATLVHVALATMAPFGLLCELRPSPVLGMDTRSPRFGWSLRSEARNVSSMAYQLIVEREGANGTHTVVWDSGRVASSKSMHIEYEGPALISATAYIWRVRWWSNRYPTRPSAWSDNAMFVTGLFALSDWRDADFLTCGKGLVPPSPPPPPPPGQPFWPIKGPPMCRHLRSTFFTTRVMRATAFVTAMGYVELRINAKKAGGNAVLEPGWTQWDRRLLYATYDVTPLLVDGTNVVGIILGNGWAGHLGHTPTFKLLIEILTLDGKSEYMASDPNTWNWIGTRDGPILLDDIYGGETYDARMEIPNWDISPTIEQVGGVSWMEAVAHNDPSIAETELSSQMMEPIRAMQLLAAKAITTPAAGVSVVDFGQNIAGWGRLRLKDCPRGTTIKLSFAEVVHQTDHANPMCSGPPTSESGAGGWALDPLHNCTWKAGMVNMQYLMCVKGHGSVTGDRCAYDLYTCRGGQSEIWEPRFTYHGFRYAQLEDMPSGLVWELDARVVHSDVEGSSQFSLGGTAAASIMQLQSNIQWTQRDNLHSVPTDCPQRTERQGWMADASVSAEQAWHNFVMAPFYRNWLRSIVDVQIDFPSMDPADKRGCGQEGRPDCKGAVTDTVPHPPGTFGSRPADPSWSAGFDLMYWYLLRYSGDRITAMKYYPSLRDYIEYELSIAAKDPTGLNLWYTTGDWVAPHNVAVRDHMTSAFNTILGIKILRDTASVLGYSTDLARYDAVVADQLQRWHATFYNQSSIGPNPTYGDGSQDALTYTLFLNATPNSRVHNLTLEQLAKRIVEDGTHVTTGIIATKWLPEVLGRLQMPNLALDLVLQPTAPSWLDQLAHNATTVWEQWEYFVGPAMNSHNHPAYTSIGAWLWRYLVGIRIAEEPFEMGFADGYSYVTFAPYSAIAMDYNRISSASASLQTQQGIVSLQWSFSRALGLHINVTLPPNTAGEIRVPSAGPGRAWGSLREEDTLIWHDDTHRSPTLEAPGHEWNVNVVAEGGLVVNIGSGSYRFMASFKEDVVVIL